VLFEGIEKKLATQGFSFMEHRGLKPLTAARGKTIEQLSKIRSIKNN
jgi:hypothetical protein